MSRCSRGVRRVPHACDAYAYLCNSLSPPTFTRIWGSIRGTRDAVACMHAGRMGHGSMAWALRLAWLGAQRVRVRGDATADAARAGGRPTHCSDVGVCSVSCEMRVLLLDFTGFADNSQYSLHMNFEHVCTLEKREIPIQGPGWSEDRIPK